MRGASDDTFRGGIFDDTVPTVNEHLKTI